eukprot:scpid20893/ scgid25005/ Metabotropic glutamate receptor 2
MRILVPGPVNRGHQCASGMEFVCCWLSRLLLLTSHALLLVQVCNSPVGWCQNSIPPGVGQTVYKQAGLQNPECQPMPARHMDRIVDERIAVSRNEMAGNASLLVGIMASSGSFDVEDGACIARPQNTLDLLEPVMYVLEEHFAGTLAGAVRPDWAVRLGYVFMDDCRLYVDGSLSVIMSSLYSGPYQRSHVCVEQTAVKSAPPVQTAAPTSSPMPPPLPASLSKTFMLIGPTTSDATHVVSPMMSVFRLPTISASATNDAFTCQAVSDPASRKECARHHSYFYRTAASDFYQAKAMVELMVQHDWKLAIAFAVDNVYGSSLMNAFGEEAAKRNICIAYSKLFSDSDLTLSKNTVVQAIVERPEAMVVVLFASLPLATKLITNVADLGYQEGIDLRRIWIGSDGWSNHNFVRNNTLREYAISNILSVRLTVHPIYATVVSRLMDGFRNHLRKRTLESVRSMPDDFVCRNLEQQSEIGCLFCNTTCNASRCQENYEATLERSSSFHSYVETNLLASLLVMKAAQLAMDSVATRLGPGATHQQLSAGLETAMSSEISPVRYLEDVVLECGPNGSYQCMPFRCMHELPPAYEASSFNTNDEYRRFGTWSLDLRGHLDDLSSTNCSCSELILSLNEVEGGWSIDGDIDHEHDWGGVSSSDGEVPLSSCSTTKESAQCPDGWEHVSRAELPCCIWCEQCKVTEFVNISADGTRLCSGCVYAHIPNADRTACMPAAPQPLDVLTASLLLFFALGGGLAVVSVTLVFHRYRHTPIIKGTDYRFTVFHLLGMLGGFLTVMPRVHNPTTAGCIVEEAGGFLFFTLTMAISLVKTSRFARLVLHTTRIDRNDWTFSNTAQAVYIIVLVLIGGILYLPWRVINTPGTALHEKSFGVVYLYCTRVTAHELVMDAYILFLILITCILGFFTRKLPNNYNEARQMFMGALSACLVWFVTSAPYYNKALDRGRSNIFLAVRMIGHMWSLLLWMYSYRVYVAVFRPEKNTMDRCRSNSRRLSRTIGRDSQYYKRQVSSVSMTSRSRQSSESSIGRINLLKERDRTPSIPGNGVEPFSPPVKRESFLSMDAVQPAPNTAESVDLRLPKHRIVSVSSGRGAYSSAAAAAAG